MAVQFSPKTLGLNTGNFGTVFGQSGTEFARLFSESPGLKFRIVSDSPELKFRDYLQAIRD